MSRVIEDAGPLRSGKPHGFFFVWRARLEIVLGPNPREIVFDVVPGSPTKRVGGCVGGNPVSGGDSSPVLSSRPIWPQLKVFKGEMLDFVAEK